MILCNIADSVSSIKVMQQKKVAMMIKACMSVVEAAIAILDMSIKSLKGLMLIMLVQTETLSN